MEVEIDGMKYGVRHNYLHRAENPRIVLEHKENAKYVSVQFDQKTDRVMRYEVYSGYRVGGEGYKNVTIRIIEP